MTQQTSSSTPAPTPPAALGITPPTGLPSDPRPRFLSAAGQAVSVIRAVQPVDFDRPTPCAEFEVRTLCGHLLTVLRRITVVAAGGAALSVPQVITGVPDGEVGETAADDARRLAEVWADDAVLDRLVVLPFGTMPGRAAALAYTQELTVHAWDLATAIGRTDLLDDALAEISEQIARQFVPAEVRGGPVPFGPVVEVPEGERPYARLVGWLGRDPNWQAPR